jgi:hypothetical protein
LESLFVNVLTQGIEDRQSGDDLEEAEEATTANRVHEWHGRNVVL